MDRHATDYLKRLLEKLRIDGSVHYSEVEPLCQDPAAEEELDSFLAAFESTKARMLPDNKQELDSPGGYVGEALQVYLREVGQVPVLRSEREEKLLRDLVDANVVAAANSKKELVESRLGLVVSIAEAYLLPGVNMLELIERGNNGLIHAVETFRPGRGYGLSTYAVLCVHRALRR